MDPKIKSYRESVSQAENAGRAAASVRPGGDSRRAAGGTGAAARGATDFSEPIVITNPTRGWNDPPETIDIPHYAGSRERRPPGTKED